MQDDRIEGTFVFARKKRERGASCLHSIFRYYGGEISSVLLRKMSGTKRHGTRFLKLFHAALFLGFDVAVFEVDKMSELRGVHLPCMAISISENRKRMYEIVYEISKDKIKVGDPCKGVEIISLSEWFKKGDPTLFIQLLKNSTFQRRVKLLKVLDFMIFRPHLKTSI